MSTPIATTLDPVAFHELLCDAGVEFYAGVPDSLLKDFCARVATAVPPDRHVITANEGAAVALAAGYHLATGRIGAVYMQNSGLGNAVNPLTSLVDPEVYAIPVLLVIGWRGEPGRPDEPQHRKQGRTMLAQLEALELPTVILPPVLGEARDAVAGLLGRMRADGTPGAIVVREGTFSAYPGPPARADHALTREAALQAIVDALDPATVIVSTTGKTSRELFEYRQARGDGHDRDFLTVGSMGHSSQIALGIALAQPDRDVVCIDGDGAAIMHLGSLAVIGTRQLPRYRHVLINNGAHDSVGAQPTVGFSIDLPQIALACGYRAASRADSLDSLKAALGELGQVAGPTFLEVQVRTGARKDLGRPTSTPVENKVAFMGFVGADTLANADGDGGQR
jgi:phosphonopyruvate decarboxylase